MEGLVNAALHAVAGTITGVAAAGAADYTMFEVSRLDLDAGKATLLAVDVVVGSAVAGAAIFFGDKLLDMFTTADADPLFRQFYYQTALLAMHSHSRSVRAIQTAARTAIQSTSSAPPVPAPCKGGECKCGGACKH